jgi:hypothetical protein
VAFILPGDIPPNDLAAFQQAWQYYHAYLAAHRERFPPSVYAFATAAWHYDHNDPRCPHDAWVETLMIAEAAEGERQQFRSLGITLRLLGAYHDGHIQLTYNTVEAYTLHKPISRPERATVVAHDDWLVDELRFSKQGQVIHEIVFASGTRWLIECADIRYEWQPLNPNTQSRQAVRS